MIYESLLLSSQVCFAQNTASQNSELPRFSGKRAAKQRYQGASLRTTSPKARVQSIYACMLSCFSCVQLFATLWTVAPGSSVHGILQGSILEWVTIPFSRGSSPTQRLNPDLQHCRQILDHLSLQGSLYQPYFLHMLTNNS